MKKALPIIVVVVVAAGLVIGGRFFLKRGGPATPQPTPDQEAPAAEEEKSFTGKLKDALTLGQAMKCTWEKDTNNFATVYIKGDKVYSDVTSDGKQMHSIMADNCTYSWEEGKTQGLKFCFEPKETEGAKEEEQAREEYGGEPPDVEYNCVPAVVSDSMFNLPTNIKFTSLEEMVPEGIKDIIPEDMLP